MKNVPKEIYLNFGFDNKNDVDFKELNGVSWSDVKINDHDIKYILSEQTTKVDASDDKFAISDVMPMLRNINKTVTTYLKNVDCKVDDTSEVSDIVEYMQIMCDENDKYKRLP